jgi:hypothetical protein
MSPGSAVSGRTGRLSDRTTALLLVGRFPVVCCLFRLILGASLPLVLGITLLATLPGLLFYRFVLDTLREQAREQPRPSR